MKKILRKIFGKKYYFIVLRNKFSLDESISGRIFETKADAERFVQTNISTGRTFMSIGIHSFRSRYSISTYEA